MCFILKATEKSLVITILYMTLLSAESDFIGTWDDG
jgi:hypothetical protein